MSVTYYIPKPPDNVYENDPDILKKNPLNMIIERIEYPESGGIFVWYVGQKYPKKGFPYPEAVESICDVKRVIVAFMTFVSKVKILAPFFYIFQKQLIESFVVYAKRALERHYLKPSYLIDTVKHLYDIGMAIAKNDTERELVKIISHIIQYDSAYRIRMQILAEEAYIDNPKKLVEWMIDKGFSKEKNNSQASKWLKLKIAFVFLPYKRFIKDWINHLDLTKLLSDESDRYYYPWQ